MFFLKIREKRPIFDCKSLTGKELFLPLTLEKSVEKMEKRRMRNPDFGMRKFHENPAFNEDEGNATKLLAHANFTHRRDHIC